MTVIDYTATLTTPLHHGSGSSGNTSLLRTEDVIRPDGRQAQVPFVSGNSIRHLIRSTIAWHAAVTLGIEDGSLPKPVIDLLWSGGAVTSTGAEADLEMAKRVEDLFPALSLMGYAAQSDIISGTLEVSHLYLVCEENSWRYPGGHHFKDVPAARFRGEEFGTRHDVSGTPVDRFMDTVASATGTSQMIYDMQVLKPGAIMWGQVRTRFGATDAQERVLNAALTLAAPGGVASLAAKTSVGFGQSQIDGWPYDGEAVTWWENHLRERREDILGLLGELGK